MALPPEELEMLLAAPAMDPPGDERPNFDNPPNQNGLAWFVTTFCIAVATLCLLLRTYIRTWKEKKFHREEILMWLAYGSYWGTAYAGYSMIWAPGYYVHQWHLQNEDLVRPLYLILIYGCCYSAVLPLIKTAILCDWSRVFVPSDKFRNPFWWGCVCLSVFQCIWGVCCIVLLNMQCRPHNAIWEFYVPSQCYSLPKVMLSSASVQVITDVFMVLLPQRIIWGLHMNWQRKLGISVIFGVGLVACLAACFRLYHTVAFAKEPDQMYFIGPLLFWAWAEMTAGFFILSVPCLPRLLAEAPLPQSLKSVLGLSAGSKKGSDGSNQIVTIGGTGGQRHMGKPKMVPDSYYKIGEGGNTINDIERSESQENLRNLENARGKRGVHVTRTTHVTVTSDSHSGSEAGSNHTAWAR